MNIIEKTKRKKNSEKIGIKTGKLKKTKFALYWESEKEPGFEIVDMRAVLK